MRANTRLAPQFDEIYESLCPYSYQQASGSIVRFLHIRHSKWGRYWDSTFLGLTYPESSDMVLASITSFYEPL